MRRIEKAFSVICNRAKQIQKGEILNKRVRENLFTLSESLTQHFFLKRKKIFHELKLTEAKLQLVEYAKTILKDNIKK